MGTSRHRSLSMQSNESIDDHYHFDDEKQENGGIGNICCCLH